MSRSIRQDQVREIREFLGTKAEVVAWSAKAEAEGWDVGKPRALASCLGCWAAVATRWVSGKPAHYETEVGTI
jgi:hypothetical protein